MKRTILLRCDYFLGSGVGHLKRSNILARELEKRGFVTVLLIDKSSMDILLPLDVQYETFSIEDFNEIEDVKSIKKIAIKYNSNIVIGDSYRITPRWIKLLKEEGFIVILIDDLHIGSNADLSINYTPLPSIHNGAAKSSFLLGPKYFITDSIRFPKKERSVHKIIAHAGGNGDYSKASLIYSCLDEICNDLEIGIDWICPNSTSLDLLKGIINISPKDKVLSWTQDSKDLWSNYDIVLGPASTSLYEAIIQGSLPVSFPISNTQSSQRDNWLSIGHALHINSSEKNDSDFIKSIIHLSVSKNIQFLELLEDSEVSLDSKGTARVIDAIDDLIKNQQNNIKEYKESQLSTGIQECSLKYSEQFLKSRNSLRIRSMTTDPKHFISWPEHLYWWINNKADKYVYLNNNDPEVFSWVKVWNINNTCYLTAGWFPSNENTQFYSILKILNWQIKYYSKKIPGHTWVATVHNTNTAAIELNRRLGFVEADSKTLDVLSILYPGTNSHFYVFERKSI
tara:strand:- start:288 stop:1820 length:1533 start_codon:yes stop_codon:yes gene_type:complete